MRSFFTSVGVSLLVVVLGESGALADGASDKVRAREAYDRGTAAHERGDFAAAAIEYARADEIAPSPVALQAALDEAIKADEPGLGAELLERTKRGPTTPALEGSMRSARAVFAHRAGQLRVVCTESVTCLATVDGRAVPVGKATWQRAGQHTIIFQVGDQNRQRLIDLKGDDTMDVAPPSAEKPTGAVVPSPVNPADPAAHVPPSSSTTPSTGSPSSGSSSSAPSTSTPSTTTSSSGVSPVVFWVGAGATAVLGGITVFSAIDTDTIHHQFIQNGCDKTAFAGCNDKSSQGANAQTRTNVLLGATAAFGVATAVIGIFFVHHGEQTSRVSAAITPAGASAVWTTRF
jgi:hypothetical protein